MKFKEYFQKHVLKESPMRLGMSYDDILDNEALNQQEARELIQDGDVVERIKLKDTIDLTVYRAEFESTIDYFVNKTPFVTCYFIYKMVNGGMQMTGVWNRKSSKSMAFHLFFEYYLPKVKSITSDSKHTLQGENFWKRLIKEATARNKTIKAVKGTEEIDIDDVDKFWGNTNEFYNYKLRIYN